MTRTKIFALIFAIAILFCGCSAKDIAYESVTDSFDGFYGNMEPESGKPMESPVVEEVFDSSTSYTSSGSINPVNRKLIRTFTLEAETLEFDSFVSSVKNTVAELGGYIESSGVSGNSYNYTSNRSANFVCRIPSEMLDSFVSTVGGLGNITYSYEDATDVTLSYVDTESRIASLQTEYDRLLELLAEADSLDSIIILEQRISEVRYQLESYKSQLRTYDNLVDYSTVNLNVREVKRITAPEQETVWERIRSDFEDNIYNIWVDVQDFFVWFVSNIPYFLIWAIVITAIVLVFRLFLKKCPKWQERKAARKARKEYKKVQKLAEKNASEGTQNTEEK